MKKILLLLILSILVSSLCGCKTTTSEHSPTYRNDKIQFTTILDSGLVFDSNTQIVYICNYTNGGNEVFTAYFAPNGKPYKYDTVANVLVEIP